MTMLQVSCPQCGPQTISPDMALLLPGHSEYAFECPGCGADVVKQADYRIASLLLSAGVQSMDPDSPASVGPKPQQATLPDANVSSTGPDWLPTPDHAPAWVAEAGPITYDDILDAHLDMDSELATLLTPPQPIE